MLKPAQFDLKVTRGFDFSLPLNVRGRDASGNKTTLNLTGYTLESKMIYDDGTVVTVTTNWITQTTGALELFISRTVTTAMPLTGVRWYFAILDPAGRKTPYMDGAVLVRDPGARQR